MDNTLQSMLTGTELKLIGTVAVLVVLSVTRSLLLRTISRRITNLRNRYLWRQIINYAVFILGLVILVRLWFEWFQSVLTVISLIAAAITIVSKDLILSVIAHGVIFWRRLFDVGDRIQIGPYTGDVMEVGLVFFSLAEIGNWVKSDESTGRLIKVPNSLVLTQPVANYTRGMSLIWNELELELTLDSNWRAAREIALSIATAHAHPFSAADLKRIQDAGEEIMFTRTDTEVSIKPQSGRLVMSIRYPCKFHKRHTSEQRIWEGLLIALEQHPDIRIKV